MDPFSSISSDVSLLQHFDLSMPMFPKLPPEKAGLIPVKYCRVPCNKKGWVRFEIEGNPNWLLVLLYNVGGTSDVSNVKLRALIPIGFKYCAIAAKIGRLAQS